MLSGKCEKYPLLPVVPSFVLHQLFYTTVVCDVMAVFSGTGEKFPPMAAATSAFRMTLPTGPGRLLVAEAGRTRLLSASSVRLGFWEKEMV